MPASTRLPQGNHPVPSAVLAGLNGVVALAAAFLVTGCAEAPPRTSAECQIRRDKDRAEVLAGLRRHADSLHPGSGDAGWLRSGAAELEKGDIKGFFSVTRVCGRNVRTVLGAAKDRLDEIDRRYSELAEQLQTRETAKPPQ